MSENCKHLIVVILILCAFVPAFAQNDAVTSNTHSFGSGRLFRIAYVRPAGEADLTRGQMEELRDWLESDEVLQPMFREQGYVGIGLFETDGGADMLLRLNAREFDIAFVPSRIWLDQQENYSVILQTRRPRDITSTRGQIVLQHGIVFLSPRSPFFDEEIVVREEFADYLSTQRIAVESSQSLAGFIAPITRLTSEYDLAVPSQDFLWCRSSAEVTKAVLAGLADVGICEQGGLEQTLESEGLLDQRENLYKVVLASAPVPTDPVVVRAELAPARSVLGRAIKSSLRNFSLQSGFGSVSLQHAQDSDYEEVQSLLDEFKQQFGALP